MKPKIYISRPIGTPMDVLNEIRIDIEEVGGEALYWKEGTTYKEDLLKSSNAVIFITNKNVDGIGFDTTVDCLTLGVKTELDKAISWQLPIFKVYHTKSTNTVNIYNAKVLDKYHPIRQQQVRMFCGIAQTLGCLDKFVLNWKAEYNKKVNSAMAGEPLIGNSTTAYQGLSDMWGQGVGRVTRIPTMEEVDKQLLLLRRRK